MKTIVILTGSEKRHTFFRKYLKNTKGIKLLKSFSESQKGNIQSLVKKDSINNDLRTKHLLLRDQVESDFFEVFNDVVQNSNNVFIEKGEINNKKYVSEIIDLNPDLIISYGCSIIKSNLISSFKGRFINIHLGISPYYRGAGTNYFPFVNNELQFVGVTYMFIDKGIDTGNIIHQFRAKMNTCDSIHTIGNRLIKDMAIVCSELILKFDSINNVKQKITPSEIKRLYRKKDFTEESLRMLYNNITKENIISKYLENKYLIDDKYPIINLKLNK
ncbi:Formyl transferase [Lutibacter agarilyticus]|uniref:phosphoribosylglycinamide formyltransferase 1 n=1 Tax=Lutibacter agarilyticus TaxID=1109740 RepID=A0A238YZ00_9FLAO|nr:formyltransferase family protein [Lutibacter agarilyticus]SNR75904.1 Formyl transferase [Lutibacter agarilyticus]